MFDTSDQNGFPPEPPEEAFDDLLEAYDRWRSSIRTKFPDYDEAQWLAFVAGYYAGLNAVR